MIIWNKKLFPGPHRIENLTSHVDVVPTLLGLAGISPEPIGKSSPRIIRMPVPSSDVI